VCGEDDSIHSEETHLKDEHLLTGKKQIFFYGWWIVLVNFMADFMAVGVGVYAFAVFIIPMTGALNWSRGAISVAPSLRTMVAGLMGPVVGPFIDKRNGARIVMGLGGVVAGVALILCSVVHAPWQFYLSFGILGAVGMSASSFTVGSALIGKWFVRKRGRALAFAGVGISAGGVFLVPLAHELIDSFGWRFAWIVLGVIYWLLVVPASLLLIRRQPEDLGLLPDGAPASRLEQIVASPGSKTSQDSAEFGWTRQEAMRTPAAWLIVLSFNFSGLAAITILVHEVAYFESIGISTGTAVTLFTLTAFCGAVGKVGWGFLAERVNTRLCIIVGSAICIISLSVMLAFSNLNAARFFAIFIGLGWGGFAVLQGLIWAEYFGREHLGAIRGFFAPFNMISSVVGPVGAGMLYDLRGDYEFALSFLLGAWVMSILTMSLARPPGIPERVVRVEFEP
jgi:MFS family permease